tara:strand:+ start:8580 stop:8762 length:183 start_codon:yes stop_codon:yes gene_type:complete
MDISEDAKIMKYHKIKNLKKELLKYLYSFSTKHITIKTIVSKTHARFAKNVPIINANGKK